MFTTGFTIYLLLKLHNLIISDYTKCYDKDHTSEFNRLLFALQNMIFVGGKAKHT